jgi:hypothetical protein
MRRSNSEALNSVFENAKTFRFLWVTLKSCQFAEPTEQFFHAVGHFVAMPLARRYTCTLQQSPVFGRSFGMRHNTCRVFGEDNPVA